MRIKEWTVLVFAATLIGLVSCGQLQREKIELAESIAEACMNKINDEVSWHQEALDRMGISDDESALPQMTKLDSYISESGDSAAITAKDENGNKYELHMSSKIQETAFMANNKEILVKVSGYYNGKKDYEIIETALLSDTIITEMGMKMFIMSAGEVPVFEAKATLVIEEGEPYSMDVILYGDTTVRWDDVQHPAAYSEIPAPIDSILTILKAHGAPYKINSMRKALLGEFLRVSFPDNPEESSEIWDPKPMIPPWLDNVLSAAAAACCDLPGGPAGTVAGAAVNALLLM